MKIPFKGVQFEKRKNGSFRVVFTRQGKIKRLTLSSKNEALALAEAVDLGRQFSLGEFDPWAPVEKRWTWNEVMTQFEREPVTPRVKKHRKQRLNRLWKEAGKPVHLDEISSSDITRVVWDPLIANETQLSYYGTYRTFYRWCERMGYGQSPMDGVRKPTRKKKIPVFLSKKEYHTLIETIGDNWMRPLVMFAVGTGMRRAEILAQRWIDVESDLIHIRNHGTFTTKSGHERSIPISKLAREALKLQKEEGEYVFSNKNGGRLSPDLVTKAFRRWKKRAGLREEIHFHSCRHTFASWKAQAGVPLNRIQLWLGHSDSRQTEIYAHLLPENVLGEIDEGMI